MSSQAFALRMDYDDSDKQPIVAWLDKQGRAYLVVHETHEGENPHVHVVFHSDKKLSALRMDLKRKFPNKVGNGAYSLKECDDDVEAYMRYMCKGDSEEDEPVVLAAMGLEYSVEKIKEAHAAYWVNHEALASNAKKRKKLPSATTVIEKLEQMAKSEGVTDKEGLAKMYIRMMRDARKPINVFAARAVVNTVSLLVANDDSAFEALANSIAYV